MGIDNSRNTADRPDGMRNSEIGIIQDLIGKNGFSKILEIGMANASSSVAMLDVLNKKGRGTLTSIDPYQLVTADTVALEWKILKIADLATCTL